MGNALNTFKKEKADRKVDMIVDNRITVLVDDEFVSPEFIEGCFKVEEINGLWKAVGVVSEGQIRELNAAERAAFGDVSFPPPF